MGASPPCTVRTQGIFAWPPRKNVLDVRCASVRCGLCMWVSVLQWRKVPLPFSVSLDGRLYLCFALRVACGRTAPPVCSGTNRKTASLSAVRCTAGMLWCTPENRVSLGGTLRRRYAMVHTGKPCLSLRHAEPPVCSCEVQTVEETRRGRCQFPSDGARFQLKRVNWYAEAADSSVDQY